jgi:hypothetical protein
MIKTDLSACTGTLEVAASIVQTTTGNKFSAAVAFPTEATQKAKVVNALELSMASVISKKFKASTGVDNVLTIVIDEIDGLAARRLRESRGLAVGDSLIEFSTTIEIICTASCSAFLFSGAKSAVTAAVVEGTSLQTAFAAALVDEGLDATTFAMVVDTTSTVLPTTFTTTPVAATGPVEESGAFTVSSAPLAAIMTIALGYAVM